MRILYSFNKLGFEADYWQREIASASDTHVSFVPLNHGSYVTPNLYLRAQQLDNLYYERHPDLFRLYADVRRRLQEQRAEVLLVDNCPPYHPEFLRTLDVYKVLRVTDGPVAAYDRDFAYLHAYDHVLYHSPAYSRDLTMPQKLSYCGARRHDFWPLAVFDAFCQPQVGEETLFAGSRDIEVVFVGALHLTKMPFLAALRHALGRRLRMYGLAGWKKNLYFNAKYRLPGWVTPLRFEDYVPLYRRSLLGVNAHQRGKYTVGSYRLFDLPANGVMQLSDGAEYLAHFFEPGREIVAYRDIEDLIPAIEHYLTHPREREEIARAGYQRAMRQHRIGPRLRALREILSPALRG
jgi:spore maturation protein CgeB